MTRPYFVKTWRKGFTYRAEFDQREFTRDMSGFVGTGVTEAEAIKDLERQTEREEVE